MTRGAAGRAAGFASPQLAADFAAAYDDVLAMWPDGTSAVDVAGAYGSTRVQQGGPPVGPPLILLAQGGCPRLSGSPISAGQAHGRPAGPVS